jgi:hypothetical protein
VDCHMAHTTCGNRWLVHVRCIGYVAATLQTGFWSVGQRELGFDPTVLGSQTTITKTGPIVRQVADAWHIWHMSMADWFTPFMKPTHWVDLLTAGHMSKLNFDRTVHVNWIFYPTVHTHVLSWFLQASIWHVAYTWQTRGRFRWKVDVDWASVQSV